MRTTNKQFTQLVQAHIISSLSEDYTNELRAQLQNVVDEFNNYYHANEQKRNPNKYTAFIDFLNGLPSCLSLEYTYHGIFVTLKSWFEACGETYIERSSDKEADLYHHLVVREFSKLCRMNGVTF